MVPFMLQVAFIVEYEPGKPFNVIYTLSASLRVAPGMRNRNPVCRRGVFNPSKPRTPQGMTLFGPDFEVNLPKLHELTAVESS